MVAVIVNHFNKDILPSGYLGVDMFFVISGFVITSSLAGRSSQNLGDFLAGFYVRRIKRIIPPLVLFVVLTSALLCLFNPGPGVSMWTGVSALFGVSNLYLLKGSTDYFAVAAEINVFTHTWSLGVEEQFYLLFPPLLWWAGVGRVTVNRSVRLMWVTGALSLVSLASFIYLYQVSQPTAYFSMPTRFWELAVGSLLFVSMREFGPHFRLLETVPASLLAVSLLAVLFTPFQLAVPATVAVVTLSALLIARLGRHGRERRGRRLRGHVGPIHARCKGLRQRTQRHAGGRPDAAQDAAPGTRLSRRSNFVSAAIVPTRCEQGCCQCTAT